MRRASPANADAPAAAAASAPSFNLDMIPSHFPELPSSLRELPSLGLGKEVAHLLEQLSTDLLGASGRGFAAGATAAAAGGDRQQQQDQDRGGQRGREQGTAADLCEWGGGRLVRGAESLAKADIITGRAPVNELAGHL